MAFSDKFGGNPQRPAFAQYLALLLAATVTPLVWPIETVEGVPYVAAELDVTPTAANQSLAMPAANQGSTGIASIVTNVGALAFTLTDGAGNQIVVIQPGVSWIISVTNNSSVAGLWRAYQLGATVSNASAGQLADNETLQANGSTLNVFFPTNYLIQNTTLQPQNRGSMNVWQGSVAQPNGTYVLSPSATLTAGWFAFMANESLGTLTIQPSNSETINLQSNLVLQPGNAAMVICSIVNGVGIFNAFGLQPSPLPVNQGGTGATTPTAALTNFGGTTTGIGLFTSASAAAAVALLGLQTVQFTESTIATNQTLTLSSTQTVFVATAALALTLPLSTLLTTKYVFCVFAQGGAVTVTPQVSDKINNGTAGANFTVTAGTSAMFVTDANGNWWPVFSATAGTVSSVGLASSAEFAVSGSPVTTTGTLTFSSVTQAPNTVWAGPTSGGAAQPSFRALGGADGAVPSGTVMASAAVQTPAGYLLCDGTAVSRTTFSTLFNACTFQTTGNITNGSTGITNVGSTTNLVAGMPISAPGLPTGTTITAVGAATITLSQAAIATTVGVALVIAPYGVGDGSTTFNVPDMRGRAPFGADKMVGSSAGAAGRLGSNSSAGGFSSTVTMGTGGGAQTHVQTAGELVSHSHANTLNDPTHFHQQLGGAGNNDGAGGNGPGTNPGNTAAASTGITITNVATGGGAAMNITPPGLAFNWYVKT